MPKIRDLGTSVIPVRRPRSNNDVGLQAAARKQYDVDSTGVCDPPTNVPQCAQRSAPRPGPAPGCEKSKKPPGTKPKKYAYGSLDETAVAQLRSQLDKAVEQRL